MGDMLFGGNDGKRKPMLKRCPHRILLRAFGKKSNDMKEITLQIV